MMVSARKPYKPTFKRPGPDKSPRNIALQLRFDPVYQASRANYLKSIEQIKKGLCPKYEQPFMWDQLVPRTQHGPGLQCLIQFIAKCGHSCAGRWIAE